MKFIGHLDIMRYFQKAVRRAGIDIAYSEGMSPHMIMSFASPLGVGLTSDGEYMDIEIHTPIASAQAIDALNSVGVEGITVTQFRQIGDTKADRGMTLIAAADYELSFRSGYEPRGGWQSGISQFFAQKSIIVTRKTKRSEQETDIRPMIYELSVHGETMFMKLAAGSAANLKPELVMDAYLSSVGIKTEPFAYEIHRCELYADTGSNGKRRFVPLGELGMDIYKTTFPMT